MKNLLKVVIATIFSFCFCFQSYAFDLKSLTDKLQKDIGNKLQIPKALQQALPFKSKPKLEPSRKRKTLEQKRAVVQDKEEKKMTTMVQQLNTIRNEKMAKRKAQQEIRRAVKAKKDAKDNEWRSVLEKERKKSRYREEGKAEKLRALRAQTS